MMVSLFPKITATTGGAQVELAEVLAAIQGGRWAREVNAVRAATSAPDRRHLKAALPYFTASGTFAERKDAGLVVHSGIVALDLDAKQNPDWQLAHAKARLLADPYTFAVFVSAGGEGLCALVRITTDDHAGSFRSLAVYYAAHHQLVVDSLGDVSRARYVSFDPELYHNPNAERWEDVEAPAISKPAPGPVVRSLPGFIELLTAYLA
ncbi:BT4734/BF3469 family protein [Hymenobacter nivis]|nr:BT4734/BF3469 family protein [Hymenobacter nivis]